MAGDVLFVAGFWATVVVDFAVRPARSRIAHLPEVVFVAEREDVVVVDGCFGLPVARRFLVQAQVALVIFEDGGPQAVGGEAEDAGEQIPGPADGFLFIVVAKRPVAQHLEEGVVRDVTPDVFQVVVLPGDAHALLRIGGAGVGARSGAQEDVLELHHPRVDEEQGGIIERQEAGAGHDGVPAFGEVV